jgi:hypothetical protein
MAIFGKSKKGNQTTTLPPTQPAPIRNPQSSHQYLAATSPQSNLYYPDQRPQTAGGYGFPQPQEWRAAQPYQYDISQNNSEPIYMPQSRPRFLGKFSAASVTNLLAAGSLTEVVQSKQQGAAVFDNCLQQRDPVDLCDLISSKFNAVITLIDGEKFSGDERELVVFQPPAPVWQQEQERTGSTDRALFKGKSKGAVNNQISTALVSTNYFAKVNLYANSRLPPNLPPLKL